MYKKQYFQAQFKVAKTTEKGTLVRGYASTPTKDRQADIVEPEAFRKTIGGNFAKNPIVLFQHNADRPIGKIKQMNIDPKGLSVEALIVDKDVEPKVEAGILQTFSIGYIPTKVEFRDKDGAMLDEKEDWNRVFFEDGVTRTIKELELFEISIVSIPANPDATFAPKLFDLESSVKNFFELQKKEFLSINNNDMKKKDIITNKKDDEETVVPEAEGVENPVETPDDASENADESPSGETPVEDEAVEKDDEAGEEEAEDEKAEESDEADDEAEGDEAGEEKADEPEDEADEAESEGEEAETEDAEEAEGDKEGEKGFKIDPKLCTPENMVKLASDLGKYKSANERLAIRVKDLEAELGKMPTKKAQAYNAVGVAGAMPTKDVEEKGEASKQGFKTGFFGAQ